MKQEYHIELIEEHELVNFYSIHLNFTRYETE